MHITANSAAGRQQSNLITETAQPCLSAEVTCVRPAWAELMRLKSSVCEPCCRYFDGSGSTSRRQGRHREVGSEGSRSAKL
jgi:hypothetical protein